MASGRRFSGPRVGIPSGWVGTLFRVNRSVGASSRVKRSPLKCRLRANPRLKLRVAGQQSRGNLAPVDNQTDKLPFGRAQGQDVRQSVAALIGQSAAPVIQLLSRRCDPFSKQRQKASFGIRRLYPHIVSRHRAPVAPAHRAVHDEGDPETVWLKFRSPQQQVRVEEVPARGTTEQRCELAGDEFMGIEQRHSAGADSTQQQ